MALYDQIRVIPDQIRERGENRADSADSADSAKRRTLVVGLLKRLTRRASGKDKNLDISGRSNSLS